MAIAHAMAGPAAAQHVHNRATRAPDSHGPVPVCAHCLAETVRARPLSCYRTHAFRRSQRVRNPITRRAAPLKLVPLFSHNHSFLTRLALFLLLFAHPCRWAPPVTACSPDLAVPMQAMRVNPCLISVVFYVLHTPVLFWHPQVGAPRDRVFTLRNELDALCGYANSATFRVPKAVYQKLCETAAGLS